MLAIGYHYVRSAADLERALRVTALLGLVPAAIALVEWLLATRATGDGYVWATTSARSRRCTGRGSNSSSGAAWPSVRTADHIVIPRVPSTFTSIDAVLRVRAGAFASAMAVALRTRATAWMLCAVLLGLACIASGVRASYVAAPAMLALTLVLAGTNLRHAGYAAAAIAVIALAGSMLGASPLSRRGDDAGARVPADRPRVGRVGRRDHGDRSRHRLGHERRAALRRRGGAALRRKLVREGGARAGRRRARRASSQRSRRSACGCAAPLRRLDAGARAAGAPRCWRCWCIRRWRCSRGRTSTSTRSTSTSGCSPGCCSALYRAAGAQSSASDAEVACMTQPVRVAHLVSHPIQYFAPLYRELAHAAGDRPDGVLLLRRDRARVPRRRLRPHA